MGAKSRFFAWAVVAVAVAACASAQLPVHNFSAVPIGAKSSPTLDQVGKVIVKAGAAAGWQMSEIKPGVLIGTYKIRTHTAIVEVTHDTATYNITFQQGDPGLRYDPKEKTIHQQYNVWVEALETVIRSHLNAL